MPEYLFTAAITGPDARRAAEQELTKPEYHRDDPSLINRALTWIFDHLDRLNGASVGGSALLVLAVILVAALILIVLRAGRPTRARRRRAATMDPLRPESGTDHARAAEDYERTGRYAEALREWLRAIVSNLEERGVLDERPGRTLDDIARIGGSQLLAAADPLRAATNAFDEIWFGGRAATEGDAAIGRAAAAAVRQARVGPAGAVEAGYAVPR